MRTAIPAATQAAAATAALDQQLQLRYEPIYLAARRVHAVAPTQQDLALWFTEASENHEAATALVAIPEAPL